MLWACGAKVRWRVVVEWVGVGGGGRAGGVCMKDLCHQGMTAFVVDDGGG